jgi:hypothetical protein
MMNSQEQNVSSPFTRLGELARSVGTGSVARAVDLVGERRAADAFASRLRTPKLHRLAGLATIVATAAAAIVIFTLQIARNAVSWTVDGTPVGEGRYISPMQKDATVRFSEGSELTVQRGSRIRIAEAGAKTVKAVLEVGASRVRIAGGSPVGFRLEAGPFSVSPSRVASLMVEWLADELLRVSIFEGETSVYGTPSPLHLHAGQQVSANARDGTVEVRPLAAPALSTSAVPEAQAEQAPSSNPTEEPAPFLAPAPPTAGATGRRVSWPDAVAAGNYAAVLREAERRGINSVLADAPLADLVALADAARLSGRTEVGKRALSAERSRFARTSAAKDAAFFLGRIADDQERAWASALNWYETYLSEAPHGHFATEAFGRKMVAVSRHSGRAAARPIAVEYLKRFPGGPHAAVARDLMND